LDNRLLTTAFGQKREEVERNAENSKIISLLHQVLLGSTNEADCVFSTHVEGSKMHLKC